MNAQSKSIVPRPHPIPLPPPVIRIENIRADEKSVDVEK